MSEEKKVYPRYDFKASARVLFANIVKPRAFEVAGQAKGEPRYSASFLLAPDSPDLAEIKRLVGVELKLAFPGKKMKIGRLTEEQEAAGDFVEIAVPWEDGTAAADKAKAAGKTREATRGFIIVKTSSPQKNPPALAAILDSKIVDLNNADTRSAQEKYFYSGAFLAPYVAVGTYKPQNNKPGGSNLFLNGALFVKHGERIGGVNLAEVFKGHIGQASTVDPGSNDEIPF